MTGIGQVLLEVSDSKTNELRKHETHSSCSLLMRIRQCAKT